MEPYDTEFNSDYHDKYNNQTDIVSSMVGGGVAAVADFGTSLWNSLPGTPEVSTHDVLSRVSDNALRVYEENTDTIEAMSLVGGLLVPSSLAMKGLNMARSGVKGTSWFTKAGKEADLSKLDDLFSQGATATKEYRAARNAMYAKGAANQLLDSVVMEAAVLGTINAHPMMEDYMDDPIKNFAIGAAFGGVIGGGVGFIGDRFLIKGVTGKAESAAYGTIVDEMKNAYKSTNNATQVQIMESNIASLQKFGVEGAEYNELTKQVAAKMLLDMRKDQALVFEGMLSPELLKLPKENKDALLQVFAKSEGLAGVESVSYMSQKADTPGLVFTMNKNSKFQENPDFTPTLNTRGDLETPDVVFYPEFNRYATPNDAANYTRARDLGKSVETLDKELGKNFGLVPDTNFAEEVFSMGSAGLDAKYLAALKRVDSMSVEDMSRLAIAPDDLPMLNAVVARAAKEPGIFKETKFTVTRNAPNYGAMEQAVFKAGGVSSTHLDELNKLSGMNAKFNLLQDTKLSSKTTELLENWVGGDSFSKNRMRTAIEAVQRGASSTDDVAFMAANEILESSARKNLQAEMMKHADAEGNVYLYRGLSKGKAVGHSAVESYTTSQKIAGAFSGGNAKLYKVHVDDIIGSVTSRGLYDEKEILVGSPARQVEATLPISSMGSAATVNKLNTTKTGASIEDLSNALIVQKESTINSMLGQGVPLETIAIRTNTPIDTLKAFAGNTEGTSLIEAGIISEYRNAAEIGNYLSPDKRALLLKSNVNKRNWAEVKSSLDSSTMSQIDRGIKETALMASESVGAKMIGSRLFGEFAPALDIMRSQVSNFVNSKMGNRFVTSIDHSVRDMGDAGIIASTIGKNMQQISNDVEKLVLTPIKERMAAIVKSDVAVYETNLAVQVNASLKGYREYRAGQFWQKESVEEIVDGVAKQVEKMVPVRFNGAEYKVVSPSVDALLQEMQVQGRELYNMKNAGHRILGKPDMSDLGFWIPSVNPRNKYIAYVRNSVDDTTKMLWGNTDAELQSMIKAYSSTIPPERLGKEVQIVLQGDKEAYNILNGRNDALTMEVANVNLQKMGSNSSAVVKNNLDVFSELAGGYEHYIGSQTRHLGELAMSDTIDLLDRMSSVNQAYFKNQPLGAVAKLVSQPKDTANIIKNTLLGNSNLNEYTSWKSVNQSFETGLSLGVGAVNKAWENGVKPLLNVFGKKELTADKMSKFDYKTFADNLENAGVPNLFKAFDNDPEVQRKLYELSQVPGAKDSSQRLVYTSNAFAATVALRVGELAQPLVNAMSLPILTSLAIANKMPETFMGIQKGTAKVSGSQIMYEGMRASNDPAFKALNDKWVELGYFKPMVSEANETLALGRGVDAGAITQIQKALDSKFVQMMSKPSDWTETVVRRQTMFTGAVLAKRLYPELDDMGVTIFARDFMDRAVGNYHSAQRPVFFQGTAGVALGLFQTYMLTLAQNVYRSLELKNYKALGKATLLQAGTFGAGSLPGFNLISETIGEHFSDNHTDLTTGTYKALGDTTADFVLYGLPSSMGPAVYTRGATDPRFPNLLTTGLKDIAGVNFAMQAVEGVSRVAGALASNGQESVGQAFGEALSMQSISRPVARLSELATGYSVTGKGNTVATPEEVWSGVGIMSRVLSMRPLEEAKLRNAMHLNSSYGSLDSENRSALMNKIKVALRNGTLDDSLVAKVSEEYMRKGGTPTGWRSAYNTAIAQTNVSGKATLVDKLSPNNPLNFMIDNQD